MQNSSLTNRETVDVRHMVVKISDFGFSREVGAVDDQQSLTLRVGTPAYLAPEVSKSAYYHQPADIYSVGVIAFELLNKTLPTNGERDALHSGHWMPKRNRVEELMARMMRDEPKLRPTAEQARMCLSSASVIRGVNVMGMNIMENGDVFTITLC